MDAWDKLMTLKEHPELANTPGYELKNLQRDGEPVAWFLLLMEQPQLEPPPEWWFALRDRANLPWARLLAAQPRFETHCDWASVGRGELVKLAFLATKLFARKFPEGRWHDLYAFLTPHEIMSVLMEVSTADEHFDMDEVNAVPTPDMWLNILACRPHLEKYFDWSLVEKKPSMSWDFLLRRQPQFADHCDFSQLRSDQIRRILNKQPQFIDRCDWSKLNPKDREKLEAKGIKP